MKKVPNLLHEVTPSGNRRWLDCHETPLSRTSTYQMLRLGLWDSVVLQLPGSRRKRRFIDSLSIDRYFEKLMAEQKQASKAKENGAP